MAERYMPGQRVIYEEDGAILLTEVMEDLSDEKYESYDLKPIAQLRRAAVVEFPNGEKWDLQRSFDNAIGSTFNFTRLRNAPACFGLGKIIGLAPQDLLDRIKGMTN